MSTKLISIIIPVHNGENYISTLIKKLLQNPYPNLELVIGNDASSDNTLSLIKKFEGNPKVRIMHSPINIGAGALRNKLLKAASGDYIAIQDADDDFLPERFARQAEFLDMNESVSVVGSGCLLKDPDTQEEWGSLRMKLSPPHLDWFLQRSMVHASLMMRKSVLTKSHYHENLLTGEDYFFLSGLYWAEVKFANLPELLYIYHIKKSDLKNRTKRRYFHIIRSLFPISALFPLGTRTIFVLLNVLKITFGAIKSLLIDYK